MEEIKEELLKVAVGEVKAEKKKDTRVSVRMNVFDINVKKEVEQGELVLPTVTDRVSLQNANVKSLRG